MPAEKPVPSPEPLPCCSCQTPLPIVLSQESDSQTLQCTYCGAVYRGKVWMDVPAYMSGNVLMRTPPPPPPHPHTPPAPQSPGITCG